MIRLIFTTINIAICALTLLSAWGGYISPDTWILPSFAVMIFPVMAIVTPALVVADLIFARSRAWIPCFTMLLCAPAFFSFFPVNFSASSKEADIPDSCRLTFATYNVFEFNNLASPSHQGTPEVNPAISWILASRPDIICMQEIGSLKQYGRSRILSAQTDSLRRAYPYRLMGPLGLSVMSTRPIERVECPVESHGSFYINCYRTYIGNPSRPLTIVNLHLQSLGLTSDDKALYRDITAGGTSKSELKEFKRGVASKLAEAFRERATQAREVREFITTLEGDLIVCGDFNDVPGCYAENVIKGSDLSDAYTDGALGPTWTYNRERMYFRIDHIYYRGGLKAIRTTTDRNRGSDHYPIMTTFEITNN